MSLLLLTFAGVEGFGSLCQHDGIKFQGNLTSQELDPNFKVVFLGDQGLGSNPGALLKKIVAWKPNIVIHNGDFDYVDSPSKWDALVQEYIGDSIPYFVSIGNHDLAGWGTATSGGYYQKAYDRLKRIGADAFCTGEYGVNAACNYKGFLFVLSGVGTKGSNHATYIDDVFSKNPARWKACGWHKNQHLMQTGDKTDETGWAVYDTCRKHGAIVTTGHEHSFSRTHAMADFSKQTIASTARPVVVKPGQTWAVVSGLGGVGIRAWKNNLQKNPWWAATAASDVGVSYGALFCTFYINNDPALGHCDFEDINGKNWDFFDVRTENSPTEATPPAQLCDDKEGRFIELPILTGEADGKIHETGILSIADSQLSAEEHNFFNFEFTHHTQDLHNIQYAALQVYGSVGDCGLNVSIQSGDGTGPRVSWLAEPQDLEKHEVWVSPNLAEVVRHILQHSAGGALRLHARGSTAQSATCAAKFYARDHSACLAPTLVVEYAPLPTC